MIYHNRSMSQQYDNDDKSWCFQFLPSNSFPGGSPQRRCRACGRSRWSWWRNVRNGDYLWTSEVMFAIFTPIWYIPFLNSQIHIDSYIMLYIHIYICTINIPWKYPLDSDVSWWNHHCLTCLWLTIYLGCTRQKLAKVAPSKALTLSSARSLFGLIKWVHFLDSAAPWIDGEW